MSGGSRPRPAVAFDVYGTLGDVSRLAEGIGDGRDLSGLVARWRTHQLEISWLVTLMDRYADFGAVCADALELAVAQEGVELSEGDRRALLRRLEVLAAYPDAAPALRRLRQAGFELAVLSNGSPQMLGSLLRSAGIEDCFAAVISVDEVRAFKPAPVVYRHAAARLGRSLDEIWMVSGNAFDAAGAKAAGMKVAKIERAPTFSYPFADPPDLTVRTLEELADTLVTVA